MSGKIRVADILKFIILYSVIVNFIYCTWGALGEMLYINDLLVILVLVIVCVRNAKGIPTHIPRPILLIMSFFVTSTILGYVINIYSPLHYIWGARNNFRLLVFFALSCICLRKKDVFDICDSFIKLQPINIVLCAIQYVIAMNSGDLKVLNFIGDYVGGIFGNTVGCNRILNVYVMFVLSFGWASFLKKRYSLTKLLYIVIGCTLISVLAELKFVIVESILVFILLGWLIRRKTNVFVNLIFIVAAGYVVINVWSIVNPELANLIYSFEAIVDYASSSSYGENSLNRLTVVPYIHEAFLKNDVFKMLFGIGLGHADASGFSFLTTEFYKEYGYLKYNYFMHGMLYLETGAVGFITYILFFVVNFLVSLKKIMKKASASVEEYVGIAFNLIAILCLFYNTTLRSEVSCYFIAFIIAIPIIWSNNYYEKEPNEVTRGDSKIKLIR